MSISTTPSPRYPWSDYRQWSDKERWELIDGTPNNISPAPTTGHQSVVLRLGSRLEQRLQGKPCRPFVAPTDVKLSDFHVVQPDILAVCDPSKIRPSHIEGAPDLVVEVLSPPTSAKDLREKKALYQRAGVREYLVIAPLGHDTFLFHLGEDGKFDMGSVIDAREPLPLAILNGQTIPLWEVFELPEPGSEPKPTRPPG